jgi:hypothetical protein
MDWKNASYDTPPADGQKILISIRGIYYIATYDAKNDLYVLKDRISDTFDPIKEIVYWAEYNHGY